MSENSVEEDDAPFVISRSSIDDNVFYDDEEKLVSPNNSKPEDDLYESDENENENESNELNLLSSNKPISGLRVHDDIVSGITTAPHSPLIATVGDDYRLVLYKINTEHRLQCIRRIKKKFLPLDVSFDNTGSCLAIAMVDGIIEIWDVKTMKPIYTLKVFIKFLR